VTVYVDRPELVSHRESVAAAVREGLPVAEDVLSDYPELKAPDSGREM
jgi:hypothetical protein